MTAPAKPPKHRLRQEGWRTAAPFLLPSMIGMLLFSLLPLLLSALISLTTGTAWTSCWPRACCKNTLSGWQTSKPS